jgi:hypothetical protein
MYMNKKYFTAALLVLAVAPAMAQEAYDAANMATEDLNGTARYVGMGGALDALGADISTISTNPAGIGMFRHSMVSTSFGLVSQEGASSFSNANKTNMSFDQIGFVYSSRTGLNSFINFGFNFHKSRNFDQILSAANTAINHSSQANQTTYKGVGYDWITSGTHNHNNVSNCRMGETALDYLYEDYCFQKGTDGVYYPTTWDASDYSLNRGNTGYIGEYDLNLSGNSKDRFYWGLTFGIHDVHYNSYTAYAETILNNSGANTGQFKLSDSREVTGTGYDIKAGIIFRPVEESPFRIGLSVSTPTWYELKTSYLTGLVSPDGNKSINDSYKFRLYTPWKFGLSMGHTIDNMLAIGASYEYSDYSTNSVRQIDSDSYDWYTDSYYSNSHEETGMKTLIQNTLKGVSTFKIGAELKADDNIFVRLGYNYVSPVFKSTGVRDQTIDTEGLHFATTTDYTNWKSTNRITAGGGFAYDKFRVDLAYQYSVTDGDFYPYMNGLTVTQNGTTYSNECSAVKVSNKRHQVLLTLGYTF